MSEKKLAIIATKGTLDWGYPPFILASTASALGYEVEIFFTFHGHRRGHAHGHGHGHGHGHHHGHLHGHAHAHGHGQMVPGPRYSDSGHAKHDDHDDEK